MSYENENDVSKVVVQLKVSIYYVAPPPAPYMMVSPTYAFSLSPNRMPLWKAIGKIAAAAVGVYPPGIYVIRPGQLIDKPTVQYLEQVLTKRAGATVQGMVNGEIPVIAQHPAKNMMTSFSPAEVA